VKAHLAAVFRKRGVGTTRASKQPNAQSGPRDRLVGSSSESEFAAGRSSPMLSP
jgi:hypothetical protein